MTTSQARQPGIPAQADWCLELRRKFQSALGAELDFSCRHEFWWRCSRDPGAGLSLKQQETREISLLLDHHARLARPIVLPVGNDRVQVYVPLGSLIREEFVLWGSMSTPDPRLLQRFLDCLWVQATQEVAQTDLTSQLDVFAEQVTNDFEELCWLRNLTEHLDMCDVKRDERAVAREILPSLREILKAETVLLLPRRSSDASHELGFEPESVIADGRRWLSDSQCQDLVGALSAAAAEQPAVWNIQREAEPLAHIAGLRNCMLAQVETRDCPVGWLLVVNKTPPTRRSRQTLTVTNDLNDCEFGTCEASLLNAAAVMLATHARNVALFREKEKLLVGVIRALVNAMDAKDSYTCGHSDRVARIAQQLAEGLHLAPSECERVYLAGLLHDIGKIGVPDDVLLKPGGLDDEEFAKIKRHPEIGHSILCQVEQLSDLLPGVLHHHESVDGHGYPHALSGDQIPLLGRILAVADSYDAMTSCRPYRKAMPAEKAEEILRRGAGTQWDQTIVDTFFASINDIRAICADTSNDWQTHLDSTNS